LSVAVAYAQGDCANSIRLNRHCQNIQVHFKFDKHDLDLGYMGNEASLRKFADKLDSIGISKIDSIVVVSQSSPEGVYLHNLKLSRNRAETMRQYIASAYPELSSRLFVHPDGESWIQLREYVRTDTLMRQSTIDKVISVIDADVSVDTKKWRMQQLPIYRYLLLTYYPRIRNSVICMVYFSEELPRLTTPSFSVEQQAEESTIKLESTLKPTLPTKSVQPEVEAPARKLYLKTNAVGLGLGIANAAIEIDLFRHWSFTFPVFHSNWNYFKPTLKFRTNAVQPEFRYWLSEDNAGFFVGAHFGIAYYNFAFDGDYRYQDHNCKTPSIGGGLSVGYRLPVSRNNRWSVEFSLGAGAYSRHYDKFYNTPNTKDGLMVETVKTPYWGVDQAAVSIAYSFDLKKKGGNR
jgi:hypothetical protein